MITIQKPNKEDVKDIQQVFYKTWLATYPNSDIGITVEDIEERFKNRFSEKAIQKRLDDISNKNSDKLFLVAKNNNEVVGVCRVIKEDKLNKLEAIYVLPEFQGQGIGKMFWIEALKFWNNDKIIIVQVASYNSNAIRFYERLGFVDTGKRFTDENLKMPVSGILIPEMELVIIR
jgi:ribosomal protein S18 acetylase RimI-like enzyme